MHFHMDPQNVFWMPHVRWGRFESDSKSEVFVKIAGLEIHSILRSMSTLRFFTEMQTSQNLFSEAELQRKMLLEISEFFFVSAWS